MNSVAHMEQTGSTSRKRKSNNSLPRAVNTSVNDSEVQGPTPKKRRGTNTKVAKGKEKDTNPWPEYFNEVRALRRTYGS